MISTFEHTLRMMNSGGLSQDQFSFLKLNTPGSINGLYAKILFLAFKNDDSYPSFCIKTVRKKEDNDLIQKGYENLQTLNRAASTPMSVVFPQALVLSSHDGIMFSIETALNGKRATHKDYKYVLQAYSEFQVTLAKRQLYSVEYISSLKEISGKFNKEWSEAFTKYGMTLQGSNAPLPCVPQHGDLTFDNLYIDSGKIGIFDCEQYGEYDIAGLDMYHFLSRSECKSFSGQKDYLDVFYKKISATPLSHARFFLLHIADLIRKRPQLEKTSSADEIVKQFKILLS